MRDPLKDPQPGDVIHVHADWSRTVIERDGDSVTFTAYYDGEITGPYELSVDDWASVRHGMPGSDTE